MPQMKENYTIYPAKVYKYCHSLNTEQIEAQISRISALCSVLIICTVIRVSGKCASRKVAFIKKMQNFTLEQATEAQRWSRGITLLFL